MFAAIAALLSIVGRFTDDGQTEFSDPTVALPATTEPVIPDDSTLLSEDLLEPGMCVFWLLPGENSVVATVPCSEAHLYEVFAVVDAGTAAADYDGPEEAYELGREACLAEFSEYVGEGYDDSPWYVDLIPPTEAQWIEEGDRTATCLLFQPGPDGDIFTEGTARGSGSGTDSS